MVQTTSTTAAVLQNCPSLHTCSFAYHGSGDFKWQLIIYNILQTNMAAVIQNGHSLPYNIDVHLCDLTVRCPMKWPKRIGSCANRTLYGRRMSYLLGFSLGRLRCHQQIFIPQNAHPRYPVILGIGGRCPGERNEHAIDLPGHQQTPPMIFPPHVTCVTQP